MKNLFNSVLLPQTKSNVFDLSYDNKLSFNMGELVPTHVMECVPGDKITMSNETLLRFSPLIAPVMHKVDVFTHYFFVPNRLVWNNWQDFITNTKDPLALPVAPFLSGFNVTAGSLADYMGLPLAEGAITIDKVSAIPFAAYQLIYNEYYRDQNLIAPNDYALTDGSQTISGSLTTLRKRAWQHDYFTASLPFAQKGDAVTIPLIQGTSALVTKNTSTNPGQWVYADGVSQSAGSLVNQQLQGTGSPTSNATATTGTIPRNVAYNPNGTLKVDINNEAQTINALRRAFSLQSWLERNARGGTRYIENILAHFGVKSSDARLQRPEYLGGSKSPMIVSEVLQTSSTGTTAQGNMAGHGISLGQGNQFTYNVEEHGYIIGITSVMPKTAYQQGIPRTYSKFDPLDYYWPSFANIGEQEVKNRELYYTNDGQNDGTFGYVPRYAEYKYMDSKVSGEFRTNLSYWHMGRIFSSRPALNANFVTSDPTRRAFAVTDTTVDTIYAHVYNNIKAVRKMPKYGIPTW